MASSVHFLLVSLTQYLPTCSSRSPSSAARSASTTSSSWLAWWRSYQAFADEKLLFPARARSGAHKAELVFTPLLHWRVLRTLHNPRYAGAFVFGRHRRRPALGGAPACQLFAPRPVDLAHHGCSSRLHIVRNS
jgi:hypothetical protein